MSYISSNNNRFYVALEQSYGSAATLAAGNRIPAVKLTANNELRRFNGRIRRDREHLPEIRASSEKRRPSNSGRT